MHTIQQGFSWTTKLKRTEKPREPLISHRDLCGILNVNGAWVNKMMFLHNGPKKKLQCNRSFTSNNTYYDKREVDNWVKHLKENNLI